MNEQQKTLAGGAIGLILIAVVVYYLMYGSKPKTQKPNLPPPAPGATPPISPGQPPASSTGTGSGTFVGTGTNTPTTDFPFFRQSSEISQLQTAINQNRGNSSSQNQPLALVTVDGILGNQTVNELAKIYPTDAQNIRSRQGMSRTELAKFMSWLGKPVGTGSTGTGSTSGTGITLANYRTAPLAQRNAYATAALGTNIGWDWKENQLFEWMYAHLKGAQFFNCTKCSWGWGGYYSTRDLTRFGSLSNVPAGSRYVESEGGELKTK